MTKVNACCDICKKPMRVTAWRTEDGELLWFLPLCSSKCKSEQQRQEDAADELRRLIKHRRMFGPRARDRAVKKLWKALTNDKDLPNSQGECIDQIRTID